MWIIKENNQNPSVQALTALGEPSGRGFRQESKKFVKFVKFVVKKSVSSAQSAVLLLASVFCLRQTQVFTSEPKKKRESGAGHTEKGHALR